MNTIQRKTQIRRDDKWLVTGLKKNGEEGSVCGVEEGVDELAFYGFAYKACEIHAAFLGVFLGFFLFWFDLRLLDVYNLIYIYIERERERERERGDIKIDRKQHYKV
jgi:hypothetical protein